MGIPQALGTQTDAPTTVEELITLEEEAVLFLGVSTTKAASKTIPVQEERAKVLPAEIKKTDTDLFFHVLRPNKGLSNPKCPPTTFAKTRGVWPVVNNVFNSECVKPETNTR